MSSSMPSHRPKGALGRRVLIIMALASVLFVAWYCEQPPKPLSADAPADVFSAFRAMEHVRACARRPHAAGTVANEKVMQYIADQIEAMAISPVRDRAFIHWLPGEAAYVNNLLARIKGTGKGGAILLSAHYDSVISGPGAADDMAGCAALLEIMRVVKQAPPLKNDVIFLFTDGEEGRNPGRGLRGARAFAKHHPWKDDVRVVINFDCRGSRGASMMYEAWPRNGWLIEQLAQAPLHPITNSLTFDIYRRMPLESDYSALKAAGLPGYNFAFIGGFSHYHTSLDNVENLSPASLQHHGISGLELVRQLGDADLSRVTAPPKAYFSILGRWLIHYPLDWSPFIAASLGVLLFLIILVGLLSKRLTLSGIALCLAWSLLTFLLCVASGAGLLVAGYQVFGKYVIYHSLPFMAAALTFSCGAAIACGGWMVSRRGAPAVYAAILIWWWVGAACLLPVAMGASYLFLVPLAFGLLGLVLLYIDPGMRHAGTAAVAVLLGAGPLLVLVPVLHGFFQGLMVLGLPAMGFMAAMLLGILVPPLHAALRLLGRPIALALLGASVVLIAWGMMWPRFTPRNPQMNSLIYALDSHERSAYWLSYDDGVDAWTSQFFPAPIELRRIDEFVPGAEGAYMRADAPLVLIPPPEVTVLDDKEENGKRKLTLHLQSVRRAPRLCLYAGGKTEVIAARMEGVTLEPVTGRPWFLAMSICPPEGFRVELIMPAGQDAEFRVVDHTYRLPRISETPIPPRPPHMIVKPNSFDFNQSPIKADETLVSAWLDFGHQPSPPVPEAVEPSQQAGGE